MKKPASILFIMLFLFNLNTFADDIKLATNGPVAKKATKKKDIKTRPAGDLSSTNVDVLKANKNYHSDNKDFDYALKWAERIVVVSSNAEELKDARLDIADFNYNLKEYKKASENYKEYLKLYPGSDKADYVKYKNIESNYQRMAPSDRDQALTIEFVLQAKEFLDEHKNLTGLVSNENLSKWHKRVEIILEAGLKNLVESEINVFESNLKSLNYEGAERRLDYIKKKYLPELSQIKSIVEDLDKSLELSKKRKTYVQVYKKEPKPFLPKWKSKSFKQQF